MASSNLRFYTTAGATVSGLAIGTVVAGQVSFTAELVLWNNKNGGTVVDDSVDTLVAARNSVTPAGDDPIAQGWVYAKSSGIENPDSVDNYFDDQQSLFTRLTDTQTLEVGDIPDNCGRHVFFQVQPPVTATPVADVEIRLIAGSGPIFDALPQYFNRAFGDGLVDQVVPQIFPAIQYAKYGTWTDILLRAGGAYTGTVAKTYRVQVVAGGGLTQSTYKCSTDSGVSYSGVIPAGTTFTQLISSANVFEGVTAKWASAAGATLWTGDEWSVDVDIEPFAMRAGASNALTGYIGWGDALIYNNRIRPRSASAISGLTISKQTFVFFDASGAVETSYNSTPQIGKLLFGWFKTNTSKVTSYGKLAPNVTLGLDLFDDFAPLFSEVIGLTWSMYRGRYRRFNEVVTIPATGFISTVSMIASTWNYLQIDPFNDVIIRDSYYREDYPPLFRVLAGGTYIDEWHDDRTRIGVSVLEVDIIATVSSLASGVSQTFTVPSVGRRTHMRELTVTPSPSGTGYTVTFYRKSTNTIKEYQAGSLSGVYSDPFAWFHDNEDGNNSIYGIIENRTGVAATFTFEFVGERIA